MGKNQTLTGGGGIDTFVFYEPGQTTTISDFKPDDKIDFHMTAGDFTVKDQHGHAVVSYNGDTINLPGVTADQISQNNILYWDHPATT